MKSETLWTEQPTPQAELASLRLGVVGNAALSALIDHAGTLQWLCAPRMDGDPVFCGLLSPKAGDGAGEWGFRLIDQVSAEQRYLRNTPILETILTDIHGNQARILDFAPRFQLNGRIFRGFNLIRILEPLKGTPRVTTTLQPMHDYGAKPAHVQRGSNHIRYGLGEQCLRLTTDAPIDYILARTPYRLERPQAFVLGPDEGLSQSAMSVAQHFLQETTLYWLNWVRSLALPPDYQEVIIRAAITLKLCSNEATGAIVAALTTSIPEYGASGRTWDYRFCWLRDSYFTVQALNSLSATRTMEGYLSYVLNVADGASDGSLQPLFGLGLETAVDEHIVPELDGYRGFGPVRRGNGAWTQVQNDGYGSVILAVTQCFFDERLPVLGGVDLFHRLERIGEEAERRWNTPDAGLWEFRTRSEVHTHSAMMCWAACDRLSRIAAKLGLHPNAERWRQSAARIHAEIVAKAWNPRRNSFVATFGGEDLDASLLLMAQTGFLKASDPRFLSTVAACEADLRFGNHLYRYKRPDDFGAPETAFTACTFWLLDALVRIGRQDEARVIFAELVERRNHLGLLSEGVHIGTAELWGNFPQTYSMVGLINAAMALSRNWEEVL